MTDNFEELLKLCEDFMQTAIGVNGNFATSMWIQSLNEYKEFSKDIMKGRVKQQKLQEGILLKIQQKQDVAASEKENASETKKKLDDIERNLMDVKKQLNDAVEEENRYVEEITNLSSRFKQVELEFHLNRLRSALKERNRLIELKNLTNNKKSELEQILSELKSVGTKSE